MQSEIPWLIRECMAARTFEDAASVVLRVLLDAAVAAVAASRWPDARVLRALVHLRPAGGYRGLRALEAGSSAGAQPTEDLPFVPSVSAWRWVQAHRCPVAIDVGLGLVLPLGGPGAEPWVDSHTPGAHAGAFSSDESRNRLLSRDCTHVALFPLRSPGGAIDGAISVEVACEPALGEPFLWPGAEADLQLIADAATPYLLSLPLAVDAELTPDPLLPVVGPSMAPIVRMLRVFAVQEETVLLCGPTGVGKSRLARWVHERSPRKGKPFVVADLQTMPEDVQMGELFGWRRGAFTSAVADNPGLVAQAEGGTLFLDEIDKLSLRAQAGLLHLLEERRYTPLGDTGRERRANVRFLVGTNQDLLGAVRKGSFREDLYYRVQVLPVRIPPLSERTDEIPAWASYMLSRRQARAAGAPTLAADAVLRLCGQSWPGNLRQLDNVIRRATTLALVEQGEDGGDLVLRDRHVEAALTSEASGGDLTLTGALRGAAVAFLEEAERRAELGRPWSAERAEILRSFVVAVAWSRYRDADRVFRVLGQEALIRHRNHQKVLRRELLRVSELYAELGQTPGPELALAPGKEEE